jgi:hypothetical protein
VCSTHLAPGRHASAFEEKSNNPYKQGNNETEINTVKGIQRCEAQAFHESYEARAGQDNVITKNLHPKTSHFTLSFLKVIIFVDAFGSFQLSLRLRVSFDIILWITSEVPYNTLHSTFSSTTCSFRLK